MKMVRALAATIAASMTCACSAPDPSPPAAGAEAPRVAALAQGLSAAATADAGPAYDWPAPNGWYVDGFALPPSFAPTFPYAGLERTQQAPGFGDPSSPEFWSYAFLWWLDGDPSPGREALERALVTYYAGLSGGCADPAFPCDASRFAAHLTTAFASDDPRLPRIFVGDVAAYDPFLTGNPLTLHLLVGSFACPRSEHRAVLVAASPQAYGSETWREIVDRQLAFRCR